jgi:adenylosuccinate synthase
MSATVVCGMQWGDEGKGKIIDFLAPHADVVIRYQGGNNAGHTVIVNDQKYVLHLLPSGVLNSKASCILAPGVLVDPKVLLQELAALQERGLPTQHVLISERCHLILPYHVALDTLREESLGEDKLGTTKRGIGPAYMDKYERSGIRAVDLLDTTVLREKIIKNATLKNELITKIYGSQPLDVSLMVEEFLGYADLLKERIIDSTKFLQDSIKAGKHLLFEGAQALMLDIDHGDYPYVTSSSPTTGSASVGAGIAPNLLSRRIGVFKAYSTRVGAGPFPSELFDDHAQTIRSTGAEFGATTGRPRRCGWLDLVALRYAAQINGFSELAMMKADILGSFEQIKICVAYQVDDVTYTTVPANLALNLKPVYKTFAGWQCDTSHLTSYDLLPKELKEYIRFIEDFVEIPIKTVSLGPQRHETIMR